MEASVNEETPETMAIGEMPSGENVPHERCPRQLLATERLDAEAVGEAVYDAIRQCAVTLRPDFQRAVEAAREAAAPESREAGVLDRILENASIGATDGVPICQDTGSVWVCLEVGESLAVPGNIFSRVNDAVARAYTDSRLRMSLVRDALFDRANTGDNTPAFCELKLVPGDGATLHVLLKGGGSDNASRVVMLPPGAGAAGVRQVVLDCVREKAANACPPLVIGLGVGATFDKVAGLAKHALLREVGSSAASAEAAAFEEELLAEVNALGIGPAALGGAPTALAVHLETAPCREHGLLRHAQRLRPARLAHHPERNPHGENRLPHPAADPRGPCRSGSRRRGAAHRSRLHHARRRPRARPSVPGRYRTSPLRSGRRHPLPPRPGVPWARSAPPPPAAWISPRRVSSRPASSPPSARASAAPKS